MAGRKKGPPVPPPADARAFAVVVEQLRGDFKVFGEALGGFRQQVGEANHAVICRVSAPVTRSTPSGRLRRGARR